MRYRGLILIAIICLLVASPGADALTDALDGPPPMLVETVVAKNRINILIPDLCAAGASDIVELPISKIVR